MYKGSSRDVPRTSVSPRRENGTTGEWRTDVRRKGDGERALLNQITGRTHTLRGENYSLYKLILISLSLISLGAGDSKLAPYMFVFFFFLITS